VEQVPGLDGLFVDADLWVARPDAAAMPADFGAGEAGVDLGAARGDPAPGYLWNR
jgi:hypothetical protein